MSLLDNLPDRCTIRRRIRTTDSYGGNSDSYTTEQTDVACWVQQAGDGLVTLYEKRGMSITNKIYFAEDPQVTTNHEIIITKKHGTVIASADQHVLKVESTPELDASAGFGILYRVMTNRKTGSVT